MISLPNVRISSLLALLSLLAGCAAEPTVIGVWEHAEPGEVKHLVFRDDDASSLLDAVTSGDGSRCTSGTFAYDGAELTRTFVEPSGEVKTTRVRASLEGDDTLRVQEPDGEIVYRRVERVPAICKI